MATPHLHLQLPPLSTTQPIPSLSTVATPPSPSPALSTARGSSPLFSRPANELRPRHRALDTELAHRLPAPNSDTFKRHERRRTSPPADPALLQGLTTKGEAGARTPQGALSQQAPLFCWHSGSCRFPPPSAPSAWLEGGVGPDYNSQRAKQPGVAGACCGRSLGGRARAARWARFPPGHGPLRGPAAHEQAPGRGGLCLKPQAAQSGVGDLAGSGAACGPGAGWERSGSFDPGRAHIIP